MITIKRSPTADTRTCDWSKATKDQLLASSHQHIADVEAGLTFFVMQLYAAARVHDFDKITDIDGFHRDFQTGFKQTDWWDEHRKMNRHHLNMPDGVPDDVNLVDVIEHVVDCVMAGAARSSKGTDGVYAITLPDHVLQRALANTAEMLKKNIQVTE